MVAYVAGNIIREGDVDLDAQQPYIHLPKFVVRCMSIKVGRGAEVGNRRSRSDCLPFLAVPAALLVHHVAERNRDTSYLHVKAAISLTLKAFPRPLAGIIHGAKLH